MNSFSNTTNAGCQFTLFPMSDQFVNVILSALEQVNTSNVSMNTDDVSTFIQGKPVDLFDVAQAIFLHAAVTGFHVAMAGTFSIGCSGMKNKDLYIYKNDAPLNQQESLHMSQRAGCKITLYPMGSENTSNVIEDQIDLAGKQNVRVSSDYYTTRLDGEVNDIFHTMQLLFLNTQKAVSRLSMTFTISANSPSTKKGDNDD